MRKMACGKVLKAYLEIDPATQRCERICLFLEGVGWLEFTGITLEDGFVLPAPLGCNCIVSDISERQWGLADYEIEFASSYSGEGKFHAKLFKEIQTI